jgi:hypothetical protein
MAKTLQEFNFLKQFYSLKKGKEYKQILKHLKELNSYQIYEGIENYYKLRSHEHLLKLNETHLLYIRQRRNIIRFIQR